MVKQTFKNNLDEKISYEAVKSAYQKKPINPLKGKPYELKLKTDYMSLYIDEGGKKVLIAIRGTVPSDILDIKADIAIGFNNLKNSQRFIDDNEKLQVFFNQYPPKKYEYKLVGHSLGGALVSEFLRKYPFIKSATTFNSAVQKSDLYNKENKNIKRIYVNKDFLYRNPLNGGKNFSKLKLLKFEPERVKGFWNYIKQVSTPEGIRAHSLDQPAFKKYYNEGYNQIVIRDDY